ncbi:MAG: glycosyltransferase family 39 protein [Solirubrobacteraceae bacterium]
MSATTATPPGSVSGPRRVDLPDFHLRLPDRIAHLPGWVRIGAIVFVLLAVSVYMRTRYIGGQFWMDEALSVGIASHHLTAIPGVLRHDGSPPLFYLLLHIWIQLFGSSEAATHSMSLLVSVLSIPVGLWAGWSLFGRRAGLMAATLFTFSAFLTDYSQETRMYALMGLLGLLATAGYLHAFVFRRRRYVALFAVAQALMLYTHAWGIFFGAGSAIALIPLLRMAEGADRRALLKDALVAYLVAGIMFLPWLPNFIYQATHTAAPWDSSPRLGAPVQLSRDLLGGDRVTVALLIAAAIGVSNLFTRRLRRTLEARLLWTLIALPVATLALAWISSQITPAWVSRYFAPILGSLLLLAAFGLARAGIVGAIALVLSVLFLANPASFAPQYKSDVRDVAGEMAPRLHPGDLVVVGQPEQVPLSWYYLPSGLRYANTIGPVPDPRYMNWVDALARLRKANPRQVLLPLLARLRPGQQLLFVRPMTEGAQSWEAPWTQLVRRRSAQWGAILAADPSLKPVAWAPHNYRGACCVADSALLYRKVA